MIPGVAGSVSTCQLMAVLRWIIVLPMTCVGAAIGTAACSGNGEPVSSSVSPALPSVEEDAGAWVETRDDRDDAEQTCLAYARQGNDDACSECCLARPKAKLLVWDTLRACVCRKPSPSCADECGPAYCEGMLTYEQAQSHGKCIACLDVTYDDRDKDCLKIIATACDASEECARAFACDAKCETISRMFTADAGTDAAGDGGRIVDGSRE